MPLILSQVSIYSKRIYLDTLHIDRKSETAIDPSPKWWPKIQMG